MFEIIPKTFFYDFVGKRRFWAVVSSIAATVGLVLFIVIGPNWSLDFTGGTEVEFHFEKPTSIAEVREALASVDIAEDAVQQVGETESRYTVRLQGASSASPEEIDAVKAAFAKAKGSEWVTEFRIDAQVGTRAAVQYSGDPVPLDRVAAMVEGLPGVVVQGSPEENTFYVRLAGLGERIEGALDARLADRGYEVDRADAIGPKVGGALRTAGITAVVVSIVLHLLYVAIRFDFSFAPGAILCLAHDVAVTIGILVLTRQEFGLSTVSALLTLTGYSLNDTIVVYDRIRENIERYRRKNFGDLINDSVNQTLSRTVLTSGTTALAMAPFLIWGGPVLQQFAMVMIIGIVIGTYSSIYVAAPLTMILRENQEPIRRLFGLGARPAASKSEVGTKGK